MEIMLKFKFMKSLFFLVGTVTLWTACDPGAGKAVKKLPDYFVKAPAPDTLRFEALEQNEAVSGDTIPAAFFFSRVESRLIDDIGYIDSSGNVTVVGGQRFPVAENVEAFQVYFFQNWYQNQSLFLFDKNKKAFTGRVTVAGFYGGDGGQILTSSWLSDYNGDGGRDLVRTDIEHWLDLSSGEPAEKVEQRVSLLLWDGGGFTESNVPDSAALMRAFPVKSWW
jgi:hypothetical protein